MAVQTTITSSDINALMLAVNALVDTQQELSSFPQEFTQKEYNLNPAFCHKVPEYDPEFPGLGGEPLSEVCSPRRPEVTEVLLCHLPKHITSDRLQTFVQYFTQGHCRLRQLRIFLNSDRRHCWAQLSLDTAEEARYAQYILHRRTLDGELVRACFDASAV